MKRDMNRTTHGKNGVPELEAIVPIQQLIEFRERPCPDRHNLMRDNGQIFHAFTASEPKEQREEDGFVLYLIGQCNRCGTSVAHPPTPEARRRLEETRAETAARHANGGAL